MACIGQRDAVELVAILVAACALEIHLGVWLDAASHDPMCNDFWFAKVCSTLACERGMPCGSGISDPNERGIEDVDDFGKLHLLFGRQRNKAGFVLFVINQLNF